MIIQAVIMKAEYVHHVSEPRSVHECVANNQECYALDESVVLIFSSGNGNTISNVMPVVTYTQSYCS